MVPLVDGSNGFQCGMRDDWGRRARKMDPRLTHPRASARALGPLPVMFSKRAVLSIQKPDLRHGAQVGVHPEPASAVEAEAVGGSGFCSLLKRASSSTMARPELAAMTDQSWKLFAPGRFLRYASTIASALLAGPPHVGFQFFLGHLEAVRLVDAVDEFIQSATTIRAHSPRHPGPWKQKAARALTHCRRPAPIPTTTRMTKVDDPGR